MLAWCYNERVKLWTKNLICGRAWTQICICPSSALKWTCFVWTRVLSMISISGCGAPKFWMSKVFTLMGEKFAYYPVQMSSESSFEITKCWRSNNALTIWSLVNWKREDRRQFNNAVVSMFSCQMISSVIYQNQVFW